MSEPKFAVARTDKNGDEFYLTKTNGEYLFVNDVFAVDWVSEKKADKLIKMMNKSKDRFKCYKVQMI